MNYASKYCLVEKEFNTTLERANRINQELVDFVELTLGFDCTSDMANIEEDILNKHTDSLYDNDEESSVEHAEIFNMVYDLLFPELLVKSSQLQLDCQHFKSSDMVPSKRVDKYKQLCKRMCLLTFKLKQYIKLHTENESDWDDLEGGIRFLKNSSKVSVEIFQKAKVA